MFSHKHSSNTVSADNYFGDEPAFKTFRKQRQHAFKAGIKRIRANRNLARHRQLARKNAQHSGNQPKKHSHVVSNHYNDEPSIERDIHSPIPFLKLITMAVTVLVILSLSSVAWRQADDVFQTVPQTSHTQTSHRGFTLHKLQNSLNLNSGPSSHGHHPLKHNSAKEVDNARINHHKDARR